MAQDWATNVKQYDPDADDTVIAAIVRYCGIALQKRDSSLVSFGDATETGRVRENFLKKKLALTADDATLDAGIAAVGETMRGENFKNRVTVYYLLARHFGRLDAFGGAAGTAAGAGAAALGLAGAGVAGLGAARTDDAPAMAAAPAPVSSPPPVAAPATPSYFAGAAETEEESSGGMGWIWWLLLALLALALLWWLFTRGERAERVAEPVEQTTLAPDANSTSAAAAPAATGAFASAPAEGTIAIPEGSGVTSELRGGSPVVKVYFDTASTTVAPAFAEAAAGLKAWLAANPGKTLAVSGFNDSTGNVAANAELSKNRAQAVQAALVAAGIPEASVALVKPEDTTAGTGDDAAARRVEVTIR